MRATFSIVRSLFRFSFVLLDEQETPPAWTQEAYRPPCSEYSFCCPNWVSPGRAPPVLTWMRGVPTPLARVPPSWTWQGTPPRCVSHGILGNVAKHYGIWVPPPPRCLPHGILGNVGKHYGIWVPSQVWTDWKHYLPHPSDAGGN